MAARAIQIPDDDVELLNRLRHFIAEAADRDVHEVGPDVDIYRDLGLDSLGATCIFIDISYEFGIPEPTEEADYVELNTARRILQYVRGSASAHAE